MGLRSEIQALANASPGGQLQEILDRTAQLPLLTTERLEALEKEGLKAIDNSSMVRISPRELLLLIHLSKECTS